MKEWILGLGTTLIVCGCATVPELSPSQLKTLQTRTFENTSYENVFRAFKDVLQDEGYLIRNQDPTTGEIIASIQKEDQSTALWTSMAGTTSYNSLRGEGVQVVVHLARVSPNTVESKMVVQKVEQYSMGGQQGREIHDPSLYKSFFDKVRVEVERRKSQSQS